MTEAHALLLVLRCMNDAQYIVCADLSTCMCCAIIAARCACMRGCGADGDGDGDGVDAAISEDGDDTR